MKRLTYALIGFGIVFLIPMVSRADEPYFEFRPDYTESLLVGSAPQPVEQIFLPLNDHLSGFDVWLSNGSIPGNTTFQLYNPSGALMATRTVALPALADGSGARTKVALPVQVSTSAHQPYVIRVTTASPTLRLYHAQQQHLLAHNAVPQAAYAGGLARLAGEERAFSFTFTLYEDTESTVPVITNVNAEIVSVDFVRITFNASEPIDAAVTYGVSGEAMKVIDYSGQYTNCPTGISPCTILLPITSPGLEHSFALTGRDVWGNVAQVTGTFTAAGTVLSPTPGSTTVPPPAATPTPTPDVIAPFVSNIRIADVDHESVSIAWTTDEAANSLVVIQFGLDRITAGGNSDSTQELEHLLTVGNLGPTTPYTARVQSADASGNDTSVDFEFTTLAAPTPDPSATPSPSSSPVPTPTVSVGPTDDDGDDTEASWTPPAGGAPNGYRVDVIGPDGKLIKTIRTFDTSVSLGDVPEGSTVIVYADRGDDVFEKIASPAQKTSRVSFLERTVVALPYIMGGLGVILVIAGLVWKLRSRKEEPDQAPEQPPSPSSPFTSST